MTRSVFNARWFSPLAVLAIGVMALAGACTPAPSAARPRATASFVDGAEEAIDDNGLSLAVADFNRDGVQDLAVGHPMMVRVLSAVNGAWSTLARGDAPVDSYMEIQAMDVDRDGRVDLLVPGEGLTVLRQAADGGFLLDRAIATSSGDAGTYGVTAFEVADVDGDGRKDVVVANQTVSGPEVRFLAGLDGQPWVGRPELVGPVPSSPSDLVVASMDADGRPDVAVSQYLAGVTLFASRTSGPFGPGLVVVPPGLTPDRVAAGDVDGDGRQELVVSSRYGTPVVLRHAIDGGFDAPVPLPVNGCGVVRVADLDLDGLAEIVLGCARGAGVSTPTSSSIVVLRQGGWPSFVEVQRLETDNYLVNLEVVDLTGDGRLDLAATFLATPVTKVRLWSGVGPD
ncbi:MAG: VCBS repeat-containing protein [Myxococcales bacterium]|nr:VCBS repeat-containing protein [Myxococcales bacterium]